MSELNETQLGVLVLEPVDSELKTLAAQKIADIMHLDPQTVRLQLPSRAWRLYRTGAIAEMQSLGQNLQDSGIACFWANLTDIEKIRVFQVSYFQSTTPQATVVCQNEQGQIGSITFNWSEVTQHVAGMLPIFEQVVDLDVRGRLQRKTQTQDYAQFYDLHLPGRGCILRLNDQAYQFQQGVSIIPQQKHPNNQTTRISWNSLVNLLEDQLTGSRLWANFTLFADPVLDQPELLSRIKSHINLFRRTKTNWDPAFHLYSGLVFVKSR